MRRRVHHTDVPAGWGGASASVEKRPCPVCLKAVPVTRSQFGWTLNDHTRYARPDVWCPASGRLVRR